MADVSKLKFENGTYDIKDTQARDEINNLETEINNEITNLEMKLGKSTADLNVLGVSDVLGFQNALNTNNMISVPLKTYEVDSLKYPDEIHIKGYNKYHSIIKHKNNATSPLFTRATGNRGKITLENLTIDGNKENQLERLSALYLVAEEVNIINCRFINTVSEAVWIDATKIARIINCSFEDMAEHGGVLGETSRAIFIRGKCDVIIENNYFETQEPSVVGRSAGGIIVSGELPSTIIKNNIFKGIGQSSSANYIGCIDLYTNSDNSIVSGNKFYNYRYIPLKLQNSGNVICSDNIIDGANNDQAGPALVYQPALRGSTPAKYNVIIKNNIIKNTLLDGMGINANDTTYTKNIEISGNILDGVNRGMIISWVDGNTILSDNIITGHSNKAIEFQNVSSRFTIKHNTIDGGTDGIFARTGVATASFLIDGNEVKNNSNIGITIRGFDEVIATSNKLNGYTALDVLTGNRAILAFNITTAKNINTGTITSYYETGNSWELT